MVAGERGVGSVHPLAGLLTRTRVEVAQSYIRTLSKGLVGRLGFLLAVTAAEKVLLQAEGGVNLRRNQNRCT
jgi:hypothetical protein